MVILGLTGSIGVGKSVAGGMFVREGAAVFDADAAVHGLTGPGGAAVATVEEAFPGCAGAAPEGRRSDRAALAALEALLHPLVRVEEDRFLRRAAARRVALAVLDVPLLFETGGESRCDAVAVVWAPPFVQARRVLARPGMTPARLAALRARQLPDCEKLRRADFTIPGGLGYTAALRRVRRIVRMLAGRRGRKWPPRPVPGR